MCGVTGFWTRSKRADEQVARAMASMLAHRGPDDAGVWTSSRTGLALAHRRLSIIDLSAAGHQPMHSPCERFVLVYNGEIYNHLELRAELESKDQIEWRGHSDTETLLLAIRHWGVRNTLQRLNGMFAFALWDRQEQELMLARDRMGEKPLYYGHSGDTFLFASELKALVAHPSWRGDIDRSALALFLRHNAVPGPHSIYQGIHKLPPAHYVTISQSGTVVSDPSCYWDLGSAAERGSARATGNARELIDELDELLRDSIKKRMLADVPLGAFLSGGFDSSIVVAMMQDQSDRPVKTFTMGFHEAGFDEAQHAHAVAKHLGTEHTEFYVTPEEAMAVIPKLPMIYDEPFSDSSQIPTYLVSELARRHVTVSLSGDGGDELFCGYSRYLTAARFERFVSHVPLAVRRLAGRALGALPIEPLDKMGRALPGPLRLLALGDRTHKLGEVLSVQDLESVYHRMRSHWKRPADVVLGTHEPQTVFDRRESWPTLPGLRERMMYLDEMTYLPDDILVKMDRASMAVSLEARIPLLDHRVVEFAWQVPTRFKLHGGRGKWLLRQVLYRYVPRALMDRPKQGFSVPIEEWLRGPLRDWAESLLSEKRLREEGYLAPEPIRTMWEEHVSGRRRWHYYLWDVLMFQAWLDGRTGEPTR